MNKKILFLDVCGTITPENTTYGFFNSIQIKAPRLIALINKFTWNVFKFDISRRYLILKLNGIDYTSLRGMASKYINNIKYNQEVMDVVGAYKNNGFEVILLTATLDFIADEIASKFNFDGVISSKLKYKSEFCCGNIEKDILDSKLKEVSCLMENEEIITAMISDNYGDIELMRLCDDSLGISYNRKASYFWCKNKIKELYLG